MNQMAEEGKNELVTAINSCLCLWTGDSWRQVCTNCGVVTGTPNTLLCCWITHAEPSNLPSLTKIKFIAAITKLEKKWRAPVVKFSSSLGIMTLKKAEAGWLSRTAVRGEQRRLAPNSPPVREIRYHRVNFRIKSKLHQHSVTQLRVWEGNYLWASACYLAYL